MTHRSVTPETPFLNDLFSSLERAQIDYCVDRNYEGLPHDLCGHDLDIIVRPDHVSRFLRIVEGTAVRHSGYMTRPFIHNRSLVWVICLGQTVSGLWWGARIDLQKEVNWRTFELCNIDGVLSTSIYKDIVRVMDPDISPLITFLRSTFYGNRPSRNDYDQKAASAYRRNPQKIEQLSIKMFGAKANLLIDILGNGRFDQIDPVIKQLKRQLVVRELLKRPIRVVRNKFQNLLSHVARLWRRPGIMVAVLGLDGSGKGTLIEVGRKDLERLLHVDTIHLHFRPESLPSLAYFLGKEMHQDGPVTNPHAMPPSGFIISLVRLLYYTLDYVLGFWFLVYPKLLKGASVAFFDRYFYDYFFDPKRYRTSIPRWIVQFLGHLIPHPDLVIILKAPPKVLHGRKPELPIEEFYRQDQELGYLSEKLRPVVVIDTSCDVKTSCREFEGAIIKRFMERLC